VVKSSITSTSSSSRSRKSHEYRVSRTIHDQSKASKSCASRGLVSIIISAEDDKKVDDPTGQRGGKESWRDDVGGRDGRGRSL
jgi:hypothetical protein